MKNAVVLLVLTLAAVTAPVAGYLAVSASVGYREAAIRHAGLKRQERALEVYSEQVLAYQRYAARVERFIATAQAGGIADQGWDRHRVDIENREVSFAELARVIDDASGGDSYYFLPHRLQIRSPAASADANPFLPVGGKNRTDAVKVSLAGDFLVPVK